MRGGLKVKQTTVINFSIVSLQQMQTLSSHNQNICNLCCYFVTSPQYNTDSDIYT